MTQQADSAPRNPPDMWSFEALYAAPPVLNGETLRAALADRLGAADLISDGDTILLALPGYCVDYSDRASVPCEVAIILADRAVEHGEYADALQQTWDWPEKEAALAQCRHSVLVSEFLGRGLPAEDRMEILQAVMHVLIENGGIAAISQTNAGYLINPQRYTESHARGYVYYGLLNIRFFNISNQPGDMLMDSLGLSAFGVPDVQCHFRAIDPAEMSAYLYNTAVYLLQHGDVIADGHTLSSIDEHSQWPCQHEDALIAPERVVLDVNPGAGFAAGNRD